MKDTIIIQDTEYKVITIHRYNTDGVYEPFDIYEPIDNEFGYLNQFTYNKIKKQLWQIKHYMKE